MSGRRVRSRPGCTVPCGCGTRIGCEPCGGQSGRRANGNFELTQADAAPAYDTEEQQNIAVYKKALPSVVKYPFHRGGIRLLLWSGSAAGSRLGLHSRQAGTYPDQQPRHRQRAEGPRSRSPTSTSTRRRSSEWTRTRPRAAADQQCAGPAAATLSESTGLTVGQRVYAIGNPFGLSGTMTRASSRQSDRFADQQ